MSMKMLTAAAWPMPRLRWSPAALRPRAGLVEKASAAVAILMLAATAAGPVLEQVAEPERTAQDAPIPAVGADPAAMSAGKETIVHAYVSQPFYLRSDLHLTRPNGTDMILKKLGWDGDALSPPIDGGARVVTWTGPFGTMVDFLHNKAVARLGVGAHGRKKPNGIIDEIATTGLLRGHAAPDKLKLTDMFERLEFTHGHNVLLYNGLMRLAGLSWGGARPYVGIGGGIAMPHVEVIFTGEKDKPWTSEYQLGGPAAQAIAGLEFRTGRVSYFVEYKLSWAWLTGAITGDHSLSWKNTPLATYLPKWMAEALVGFWELPGDMLRQNKRWRTGEEPKEGRFSTTLTANQLAAGVGYVWPRATSR